MTHQEIEKSEIIERYVRHQLTAAERRAFQEHFFECAECFAQAQDTARFIAGVKQAARKGLLVKEAAPWWAVVFRPAFGFAVMAALALVVGWFWFRQSQAPQPQLAYQATPSPTPTVAGTPEFTATPPPKLQDQRDLLAQNRPPVEPTNKPISVLLETQREANAASNQLTLTPNAKRVILRFEVEPGGRFASYQAQIFDAARRSVATVNGAKARANGSLAVGLSAETFKPGKYLVKLFGQQGGARELVGEYNLTVR
jgi:hypothetical protein